MSPTKTVKKKPGSSSVRAKKETRREVHSLEPVDAAAQSVAQSNGRQQQEGRYVYGVIEAREPVGFGKIGIGGMGENVYTVHHGDVAAVLSRTPVCMFNPSGGNALAHAPV